MNQRNPLSNQTIRLIFADYEEESLTVDTDGFRAYDSLDEDAFDHEYLITMDSEYADDDLHIITCDYRRSLL